MACNTLRSDSIGELAGGRLAASAVDELLAHLDGCEACSRELDAVAALVAASEEGSAAGAPVALGTAGSWRRWAALAAGILVLFFVRTAWFAGGDPLSIEELAVLAPLPAPPATLRGGSEDEAPLWSAAMESYRPKIAARNGSVA